MEVGIDIYKWVATDLNLMFAFLHEILLQSRGVVGGVIAAEIACIGTYLYLEYLGIHEFQVQVAVDVE